MVDAAGSRTLDLIRTYLLTLGFMEGLDGLVISLLNGRWFVF